MKNIAGLLADKVIEFFVWVHSPCAQGFKDGTSEVEEFLLWLLVQAQLSQRQGNFRFEQPEVMLIFDLLIFLLHVSVWLH